MAIHDHFAEKASAIQQQFKAAKATVQANKMLSPEGKKERITALDAQRRQQVAQLQADVSDTLTRRRGTLETELRRQSEQRIEARRKLLGDQVLADIYRRQVESAEPQEIEQMYQASLTEWEREVIAGYAAPALEMRYRQAPSGAILSALNALKQVEPEGIRKATEEMRDVEHALKRLPELDLEAYNNSIADRMGVDVRYMDMDA